VPVVDASVVVDWVAPKADPASPAVAALRRFARDDVELLAPRLLFEEVGNALLTGVRRDRWSGMAADRAQRHLRALPVRLVDEPRDLDRAWELARRYDNHPVYDMVYAALAERSGTVLVTADDALRRRLVGLAWVVAPDDVTAGG
jgi:predicted nucleic acid-binding protein